MKKRLSFLLALLLLLSWLPGCRGETAPEKVTPSPTATAVPTVTGSLLSQRYEAVSEDLYRLGSLILEGSAIRGTAFFDNTLAILYDDPSDGVTYLQLFGIYENAMLEKAAITLSDPRLQLLDGGNLAVIDAATAKALVFDRSLQKISEFGGYGFDSSFHWFYCEPDGRGFWAGGGEDGEIFFFPLDGGKTEKYSTGSVSIQDFLSATDSELLLVGYAETSGRVIYAFNRTTHRVTEDTRLTSAYPLPEAALYFNLTNTIAYAPSDGTSMLHTFPMQDKSEMASDYNSGILTTISTSYGGADESYTRHQVVRVYNDKTQRLIAQLPIPEELSAENAVLSAQCTEDGYILLTLRNDRTETYCEYYLWEYSEQPIYTPVRFSYVSLDKMDAAAAQKASELSAKYGVEVLVGAAGASIQGSGYSAEAVSDGFLTYSALFILDDFLSKFPSGMITEMKVGSIATIQICLCGALKADDDYGISTAAALNAKLGERQLIIANIHMLGTLEQNLSHEFMHLSEDRIWAASDQSGKYYLSYWMEFVPPELGDSAYLYSYHDEAGFEASDTAYTWFDDRFPTDCNIAWFIDAYSRTYPTEDRARIFEYLFSAGDSLADCFRSENLMKKAQYLCAVIRASFQSIHETDKLWWERYVVPADISDFTYVQNAVG